ncbi:MAG: hypothetical protein IJ501_02460 [Bacilli bacterium]|nr:hypothetical protein [Bacilli bacterium]
MKEQEINKLFSVFLDTLNLVFDDNFYKNTPELQEIQKIMNRWYCDFKKEKTLINISLQEIQFLDLEITDFFDKYIETEDALYNYTEILSFNLSQLEKYWKDEVIERNKKND